VAYRARYSRSDDEEICDSLDRRGIYKMLHDRGGFERNVVRGRERITFSMLVDGEGVMRSGWGVQGRQETDAESNAKRNAKDKKQDVVVLDMSSS
jgi:hypothetical protein